MGPETTRGHLYIKPPMRLLLFWASNCTRLSAQCHFTGPKSLDFLPRQLVSLDWADKSSQGRTTISCTGATRAQLTNQGRTLFICTLRVPIHLSFNSQQGPPLSMSIEPFYEYWALVERCTRNCKTYREPRNWFPAWRACTATLFDVMSLHL